jgi:hypothetical protein
MSDDTVEPLDAGTHEGYLESISKTLREILQEMRGLRKDIENLERSLQRD